MFKLNYIRKGKFEVRVDNALISSHTQEKDALESLTTETINNPNADVKVVPNFVLVAEVTMPTLTSLVNPTPPAPPINPTPPVTVPPTSSALNRSRDMILPDYNILGHTPLKGESFIIPETGVKVTRLTDATEFPESDKSLIVYSRYSPENSGGDLFLVFGTNSASCSVQNRLTGKFIRSLYNGSTSIGENQEVRWDTSGNYPYRVYFRDGMSFYKIDDVRVGVATLIRDFSSDIPKATRIYNDVEGDSSIDSDHWAWMAAYYDGATYRVVAYAHYQISTDTLHLMEPKDLAGSNLDFLSANTEFDLRPNMVEVDPEGTGVIIHSGRKWDDSTYNGIGKKYINTWFDGGHLWPLNFDWNTTPPIKTSIGEEHSGWAYDITGQETFVSQNSRTDKVDVISTKDGAVINPISHVALDPQWSINFHYGKVPLAKKGWFFLSTYSKDAGSWADNQLIMIQTVNEAVAQVYRVGSTYNDYQGDYRDETPAAMNLSGTRIYVSSNWGGALFNSEVFVYELQTGWENL